MKQIKSPAGILTALLLLLLAGSLLAILLPPKAPEGTERRIVVLQDGVKLYDIPYTESMHAQSLRIEAPGGGYNVLRIDSGGIRITEADCPDQVCVHAGLVRSEGLPIICLPHRLTVLIQGPEDGLDAVTY
ncbi:MAG: NusG domain II-containing protein [Lachnospiraceae bacterium]|nr:NusG domain II-containing protein [Lachnospiraceae bacterium]